MILLTKSLGVMLALPLMAFPQFDCGETKKQAIDAAVDLSWKLDRATKNMETIERKPEDDYYMGTHATCATIVQDNLHVVAQFEQQYAATKERVWKELQAGDVSDEIATREWDGYWDRANAVRDAEVFRKRIRVYVQRIGLTSQRFEELLSLTVFNRWRSANPDFGQMERAEQRITCYPSIGPYSGDALDVKFTGSGAAFQIQYVRGSEGRAYPASDSVSLVVNSPILLDGQMLARGTVVTRNSSGQWLPQSN